MKEQTTLDLTLDFFRLMKRFLHLRLKQKSIDGLSRSEVELLLVLMMNLNEDKAAFSATEISNLLQITPAGVTHLLNPVEKAGFIERLHDPNDRRIVLVRLSDKGTEAAEIIRADVREQLIGLINHLGEEDSKTLVRLMMKTIDFFTPQSES